MHTAGSGRRHTEDGPSLGVSPNNCWDWCWDRASREGVTGPFMASYLVGRPCLDPGTLGLKPRSERCGVSQPVARCRKTAEAQFDGLVDTGWNAARRTATHLLGQTDPRGRTEPPWKAARPEQRAPAGPRPRYLLSSRTWPSEWSSSCAKRTPGPRCRRPGGRQLGVGIEECVQEHFGDFVNPISWCRGLSHSVEMRFTQLR